MQGGYEPRGSRGPGRGIYLARRAVFVLIAIVLFAFVLPRACGAFSDPDATDSAVRQQESEQADAPSGGGGSSGGSSGSTSDDAAGTSSETTGGTSSSGGSETPAGSGNDDEAEEDESNDASDDGSSADDGESSMPSTVEESIAVEEPAEAAPSGIPTRTLAEGRDRQAERTQQQNPAQLTLEPSEITLALRSAPPSIEPDSEDVRGQVSERTQEDARDRVRSNARANRQQVAASATGRVARNAVRGVGRISRSENNLSNTAGDGPAATVANAGRLVSDVPRGEARAAVRGALRTAEANVSAAENLLGGSPTGKNKRCAKNPARCLVGPALLD